MWFLTCAFLLWPNLLQSPQWYFFGPSNDSTTNWSKSLGSWNGPRREERVLMAELMLCLLLWVNGIDVHIQLVPAREGLIAVFTGIFKSAREVNGFHVVLSVHFLSVHLPANATPVLSATFTLNYLHNILCQEISIAAWNDCESFSTCGTTQTGAQLLIISSSGTHMP